MNSPSTPPKNHFEKLLHFLSLEAKAEENEMRSKVLENPNPNPEKNGYTITKLTITEKISGFRNRALITLAKRNSGQPLPWNRLGTGTPILLSDEKNFGKTGWRGVITKQRKTWIQIILEQWPDLDEENSLYRLDLSSNEIARQRQKMALEKIQNTKNPEKIRLRDVLLGKIKPSFQQTTLEPLDVKNYPKNHPPKNEKLDVQKNQSLDVQTFIPLNPNLNESQKEAVCFSLTTEQIGIIHGPPGTGKTTTVVELIRQQVRRGLKVLVCAPSNIAVDNLLEQLLFHKENAIRLGHPIRVLPKLQEHTLDLIVENHPEIRRARKLIKEALALKAKASKFTRAKPLPGEKRSMRQEAKEIFAEVRQIESQVISNILDSTPIICSTNTGLDSKILEDRSFDLCVIDEACQCTEPECWIPISRSKCIIFAGDHCQLPPTVLSREAKNQGFSVSLPERLLQDHQTKISYQLTTQYRMHHQIMDFSSQEFYQDTLLADESVRHHLLSDLKNIMTSELTKIPIHFVDTAGASYDEEEDKDSKSRLNPQEAQLICKKIENLLECGVSPAQIAIITPYSAQVRLLSNLLRYPEIEISSIDGLQGREKEVILISLVRSNEKGEIGFLADTRRMNVALTRARRKLIIIGDSATISSHPFYRKLLEYLESVDAYHSIWEEL